MSNYDDIKAECCEANLLLQEYKLIDLSFGNVSVAEPERRIFAEPTTLYSLLENAIKDAADTRKLTAFFAWSAWCASTLRPGLQYSYTNNWPPEPLVNNHSNSRHGCLERSFLNRPAWWYQLAAGCIWALEFSWLAPAGAR
jgi:hypothetical protein